MTVVAIFSRVHIFQATCHSLFFDCNLFFFIFSVNLIGRATLQTILADPKQNITFLALDNSAMSYLDVDAVNTLSPLKLLTFLQSHVLVSGNYTTDVFAAMAAFQSFQSQAFVYSANNGEAFSVYVAPGSRFFVNYAEISQSIRNVKCFNGVVHIIDRPLAYASAIGPIPTPTPPPGPTPSPAPSPTPRPSPSPSPSPTAAPTGAPAADGGNGGGVTAAILVPIAVVAVSAAAFFAYQKYYKKEARILLATDGGDDRYERLNQNAASMLEPPATEMREIREIHD